MNQGIFFLNTPAVGPYCESPLICSHIISLLVQLPTTILSLAMLPRVMMHFHHCLLQACLVPSLHCREALFCLDALLTTHVA